MKILFISIILSFASSFAIAQTASKPWNNKKCAVVLTYDDAISQHLDNALPVLDSLKLKATFYLTAYTAKDRIDDWKRVAESKHELGNHTLFHPCIGGSGREWVKTENDMNNYSLQRMIEEIKMTNGFLEALDGKKERTFAYTCGDMTVKGVPFMDQLKNDFIAARAVRKEMHTIDQIDLYNIDCYVVNGENAIQMEEWVDKARVSHSLLVILFHGVGGGNSLNVSLDAHREFLKYLKSNEKDIWIAPMIDVANFIKTQSTGK
ncbi:MAG: polysaccharide deacetylase family protein [Ferruginibacter sp.]